MIFRTLKSFQNFHKPTNFTECLNLYIRVDYGLIRNGSTLKKCQKRRNTHDMCYKSHPKCKDYIYVNDPVGADTIASRLTENWNDGYIFEANPGFGILSRAILRSGVPHLRVFEKREEFLSQLKVLSTEYNNLEIIENDFLFLPAIDARDSGDSNKDSDSFFHGIPTLSWENGAPFRFFSIISSKKSMKFYRFLLAVLAQRASMFSYGRCELLLLLSPKEYLNLIAKPHENFAVYRWSTVLYQLFFETECLDKFPPDVFMPVPSLPGIKRKEEHCFHLVKLKPRIDLFDGLINDNKVQDFYFFIRYLLVRRTRLVIPTMEMWSPSCGPRLIRGGMNVFAKFGDLSPEQLLMLFNQFTSWTECDLTTFYDSLRTYHSRPFLLDDNKKTV